MEQNEGSVDTCFRNKYRPTSFDEVLGNKETKKALLKNIDTERAILLYGEKGCGKTTLARLIAKHHNIGSADTHEWNAALRTGIDDMRELIGRLYAMPWASEKKIYIVDECHRLSLNAQDSLLKNLEEPPEHVIFVFCTTMVNKVAPTIRSRMSKYEIRKLTDKQIKELVDKVCKVEGIELNKKVYRTLIQKAEGIPRDALNYLEQIKELKTKDALTLLEMWMGSEPVVLDLCRLLISATKNKWSKAKLLWADIEKMDSEEVRRAILGYMRKVALNSENPRHAIQIHQCFLEPTFNNGKEELFHSICIACFK